MKVKDKMDKLIKEKYTIKQEMELYNGFHEMVNKYGMTYINWYHNNSKRAFDILPYIPNPLGQMEEDNNIYYERIMNPPDYDYTKIYEYETKVCNYIASCIASNPIIHNEYKKFWLFFNRYANYRHYYMSGLELQFET